MNRLTAVISAAAIAVCAAVPASAYAMTYNSEDTEITCEITTKRIYNSVINDDITSAAVITAVKTRSSFLEFPDTISDGTGETALVAIDDKALALNTDIYSVKLPSYLMTIGEYAFQGCLNMTNIEFPDTLETIGNGAFMSCTSLKSAVLGGKDSALSIIPANAFYSCTDLNTVVIGESVMYIGERAFFGCPELDITIPPTVEYIGRNAIGVHYEPHTGDIINYKNVLIRGETGSAAESYAIQHGIDFLDENNCLLGDVDGNGDISSIDASMALKGYASISTSGTTGLTHKQEFLADFNSDGMLTSIDASAILAEYARLSTLV